MTEVFQSELQVDHLHTKIPNRKNMYLCFKSLIETYMNYEYMLNTSFYIVHYIVYL